MSNIGNTTWNNLNIGGCKAEAYNSKFDDFDDPKEDEISKRQKVEHRISTENNLENRVADDDDENVDLNESMIFTQMATERAGGGLAKQSSDDDDYPVSRNVEQVPLNINQPSSFTDNTRVTLRNIPGGSGEEVSPKARKTSSKDYNNDDDNDVDKELLAAVVVEGDAGNAFATDA